MSAIELLEKIGANAALRHDEATHAQFMQSHGEAIQNEKTKQWCLLLPEDEGEGDSDDDDDSLNQVGNAIH